MSYSQSEETKRDTGFDSWGVLELMGHRQIAGHITEQTIAGVALLRVDVPAISVQRYRSGYVDGRYERYETTEQVAAYTKYYGASSVYCLTPTTEDVALRTACVIAASSNGPLPVSLPALAAPKEETHERSLGEAVEPDESAEVERLEQLGHVGHAEEEEDERDLTFYDQFPEPANPHDG